MRIAVCFHFYYSNRLEEAMEYLKKFRDIAFDLYVTLPQENHIYEKDITSNFPNTKFIYTENIGYDIYPFLEFINQIDLDFYDIIFKIHTKRDVYNMCIFNNYYIRGSSWRKMLLDSIIGSNKRIKKIIKEFESNPKVGMICSKELLISGKEVDSTIDISFVMEAMDQIGQTLKKKEFPAGTMFAVRPEIMKPLKNKKFNLDEFAICNPRDNNSLHYCLERCFGMMVSSQNYKIMGLPSISDASIYFRSIYYRFGYKIVRMLRFTLRIIKKLSKVFYYVKK